jgi:cytochrome c-type biogenesis protein CcmH/NrfG
MRNIHQDKETKELVHKVCFQPEDPKLWIDLADLYAKAGDIQFATKYYREAIKLLETRPCRKEASRAI